MLRLGLVLFAICVVSGGLLSVVNCFTRGKVEQQKQRERQQALEEIMPQAAEFVGVPEKGVYYNALDKQGRVIGYCFLAAKQGYSSVIETMVGVDNRGVISGIKILSQNETPGLGARIEETAGERTLLDALSGKARSREKQVPWFQAGFKGKRIEDIDSVDTITGATISSQAVIDSIKQKVKQKVKR
ncbi:MAG: RnfABCDGE type electron transport complex subunit G [Candidatus Omnitrophota bacterium]